MNTFTFNTSKTIISQPGALAELADICKKHKTNNPLIVTDNGIVKSGLLQRLEATLINGRLPFTSFTEVIADPPEATVMAALDRAKQSQADGVIGFGGGSSLDTAKLIALMARSGETLEQIYGVEQAKGQRLPLILIPTTAGTGSEVTAVAIVTTGATSKMGVVAPQLLPDVALLDAELTLGLPPAITASTGIDAMVHAIEAYTSAHKKNPYSDMLAHKALQLLSTHIRTATHEGDNLAARQAMLLGSCLAGQAFANSPVAAVHALAYPLGGHYHIPHGLSNSLVLPHVLRFNASHAETLYAELADVILGDKIAQLSSMAKTEQLILWLEALISDLQLPNTLAAMNIPEAGLVTLAKDAMLQQRLLINNPRAVTEQDALAIYQAAYR